MFSFKDDLLVPAHIMSYILRSTVVLWFLVLWEYRDKQFSTFFEIYNAKIAPNVPKNRKIFRELRPPNSPPGLCPWTPCPQTPAPPSLEKKA